MLSTYATGHGFIETPAVWREELITFGAALRAVIAEAERLQAAGVSVEDTVQQADWGQYADWFLAESQGPVAVAVRRVYLEREGKLPNVAGDSRAPVSPATR